MFRKKGTTKKYLKTHERARIMEFFLLKAADRDLQSFLIKGHHRMGFSTSFEKFFGTANHFFIKIIYTKLEMKDNVRSLAATYILMTTGNKRQKDL